MAVAVKTTQGTPSTGSAVAPAIISLVGVVFLLACLAIVFKLIPDLWWNAWESLTGGRFTFIGGALLLMICTAVAVASDPRLRQDARCGVTAVPLRAS